MLVGKAYYDSLPKKRMGAGVLFRDGDGKILIIKPSYKDHWSIPGGVVEKDESPLETAQRETEEEIGLKVRVKRLLAVSYNRVKGEIDENLQWFFDGGVLTAKQIQQIKPDGKEILEFEFVGPRAALGMAGSGLGDRLGLYQKILNSPRAVYLEDNLEVFHIPGM